MKSFLCPISQPVNTHCSWQRISRWKECLSNNDQEDKECTIINSALKHCWHYSSRPEMEENLRTTLCIPSRETNTQKKSESITVCIFMRECRIIFLLSGKFLGWVNLWNLEALLRKKKNNSEKQDKIIN